MSKFRKKSAFFLIGAVGYGIIELAWRGRTHPTMLACGGICFLIIFYIAEHLSSLHILLRAALCSLSVTLVELCFGIVFNVYLHMGVWDYSRVPFNFMGQICPVYSFLWFLLSLVVIPFANWLNCILDSTGPTCNNKPKIEK